MVRKLLTAMLVGLCCCLPVFAQNSPERLKDIQILHVGDMGKSDEAERFRLLLGAELAKEGFTVTDKGENADAILTGILSLRTYDNFSIAFATVQLKSRSGALIWSGDFQPGRTWFKRVNDSVKHRAENIADALKKARQKKT